MKTTIQLRDLNGVARTYLATGAMEVEIALDQVGFPVQYRKDITAVLTQVYDGDIERMWISESCRPHEQLSAWHPIVFYKTAEMQFKKLPPYWMEENYE